MDIMMISPFIFIFILLIVNLNIIFPKVFTGNVVMGGRKPKIKERLGPTIMWGISIVFFSVFAIIYIMMYMEKNPYPENDYYIFQLLICAFWLINSIMQIIRGFKPIEIREKGVFTENGILIKFKNIYSYTWKSPDLLEFDSKRIFKFGDDYQLKFKDQEEAVKFDEILQKYVKKI